MLQQGSSNRRDPFAGSGEPVNDLITGIVSPGVAVLRRPAGNSRKTPVRPSEKRRRGRQVTVTFSIENADAPDRLRVLAERWGLIAPDGHSPNVSALVEYLLLPQLEAAERGQIAPPEEAE